jgi:hypothetical protein
MDMNGREGIFRVNVDVYPYFHRELGPSCESKKFSLCAEVSTSSWQASMTESRVTTTYW